MRCLSALSWPPKSDRYTKMPTSSDGALHNSNTGWCATCINYTPRTGWSGGGKEPSTPKCSPAVDEPFRVGFHQGEQHNRRGQINSYCIRSKWNAFRFCGSLLRLVSSLSLPLENPRSSGKQEEEEERDRTRIFFFWFPRPYEHERWRSNRGTRSPDKSHSRQQHQSIR